MPDLFWHEARNLFLVAQRRGRLPPGDVMGALRRLRALPITASPPSDDQAVLSLATAHRLTAYLDLALTAALPLATLDRALAVAARAGGVPVLGG